MIGLIFLAVLILAAIFAPLIARYGPYERVPVYRQGPSTDALVRNRRASAETCSAA